MDSTIQQQIFELLNKTKKVLIILPEKLDEDNVSSALALAAFLKKIDKDAEIFSSGLVPKSLGFLPYEQNIKNSLAYSQSFVVTLNTEKKPVQELSYQQNENSLEIYIKPGKEMFKPEDITFKAEKFPADLLVFLGAKSFEVVGTIFEHVPDLFFETAKINIDNQPENEYFGNINLVDITATSVAEILAGLFESYETQLVDENIATCLLAGIIYKTHSFQHIATTPRAFNHASNLIALGGKQQEVVKHIYKTKPLVLLKLWGRALARLRTDEDNSFAYAILNANDFERSGGSTDYSMNVLNEILENISGYKIVALIYQVSEQTTNIILAINESYSAKEWSKKLEAILLPEKIRNYNLLEIKNLNASVESAEHYLLAKIK